MTELLMTLGVYLNQAALEFPNWRPALFSIDFGFIGLGEFHLRWYALGYIAGRLVVRPIIDEQRPHRVFPRDDIRHNEVERRPE